MRQQRSDIRLSLGLALMAAAFLLVLVWTWLRTAAAPKPHPAPTPTPAVARAVAPMPSPTAVAPTPASTALPTTSTPTPVPSPLPWGSAWSPDGTLIAITSGPGTYVAGRPSNAQVLLMDHNRVVRRTVTATTYANPFTGYGPAWSPDGRYLIVPSQGGQPGPDRGLYLIRVEDGAVSALVTSLDGDIYPAWSPDGASIAWSAYRDRGWRIWVMNADGTLQRQLTSQPGQTDFAPRWTADGQVVYVSLGVDRRRQIRIVDPVSRSDRRLEQPIPIIDQRFYPWTTATSDAIDHEPS